MSRHIMMILTTFLFVACTSCKFMTDPNTEEIAMSVAELTGTFLLRSVDAWAEIEDSDGDIEWKDIVADIWIQLRKAYKFNDKEIRLVEDEVTRALKQIYMHRNEIANGAK